MPIKFFCPSGHRLNAPESQQGKLIHCPACKQSAIVPTVTLEGPAAAEPCAKPPEETPPASSSPVGKPPATWNEAVVFEEILEALPGAASETAAPNGAWEPLDDDDPAPAPPPLPPSGKAKKPPVRPAAVPAPPAADAGQSLPRAESPWADEVTPPAPLEPPPAENEPMPETVERDPRPRHRVRRRPRRERQETPAAAGPEDRPSPARRAWDGGRGRSSPRTRLPKGPRMIGPEVAPPDPARVEATRWLALWLGLIVLFSVGPAVLHLNLAVAPGWARMVLLLAALEAAYVGWMLAAPDWSTAWALMVVFAAGATLSAAAAAASLATPLDQPMVLGLGGIRAWARAWFAAVMAVQGLGAYLAGRMSIRWHATLREARLRHFMHRAAG